jgi:hypothetical protein
MTMYQIEFVRRVAGRATPEVLQRTNMESESLAAVKGNARILFDSTRHINPAQGYQIVENGGRVVFQWYNGEDD